MKIFQTIIFLIFAVSCFAQKKNNAQLLENYGAVYSDNSPFRKQILKIIEKDGFAKIQVISDPLNEEAMMYARYLVPLIWEFPKQCSFEILSAIFTGDSIVSKRRTEAERLIYLKNNHPKLYLEWLFQRLEFSYETKKLAVSVYDSEAAWASIGFGNDIKFSDDDKVRLKKESKKALKKIRKKYKKIISNKKKQDKIYNQLQSLTTPFLGLALSIAEDKQGPRITKKQMDSLKNAGRAKFFKAYKQRLILVLINGKPVEMDLFKQAFNNGLLEGLANLSGNDEKLNKTNFLIKRSLENQFSNCPSIYFETGLITLSGQGFRIGFVPKENANRKFKYRLKTTLNGKEVHNNTHKAKGLFLNEKLNFNFPKLGEEICFEAEILEPKIDSCSIAKKCFKFDCPEITFTNKYRDRPSGTGIIVTNSESAKIVVKGKGYDQYNQLLEEMTHTFSRAGRKRITGHGENFWENRSWKRSHVTKACLSFEIYNKSTNEPLYFCPLPEDTCISVSTNNSIAAEHYREYNYFPLKNRDKPNSLNLKYSITQPNCEQKYPQLYIKINITDPAAKPPFTVYSIHKKLKGARNQTYPVDCNTLRCKDSLFYSKKHRFIRENRKFNLGLNIGYGYEIANKIRFYHLEIEDAEGKISTITASADFSTYDKVSAWQLKEIEKKDYYTIIKAPHCDSTSGMILGAEIPGVNYHWENQDTMSNLLNLKPGKYKISYHVACNEPIQKTIVVPTWKSNIERIVRWTPPGDSCKGEIIFKLKKEFLPYQFSMEEKRNVWNDTLVNDTIFKLSNLCSGYHSFKVDNPETCPEQFLVYINDCKEVSQPITQIKNASSPTAEDGQIRLKFHWFGTPTDSKFKWDNGKEGFLNYGLKKGKHKLLISNEYGCEKEFEFEIKSD